MYTKLERRLWRYEYGRLTSTSLAIELRDALDRLSDARVELESSRITIESHDPALLRDRDAALRAARFAIEGCRFREALQEIHRAHIAASTATELLHAARALHETENILSQWNEKLATETLQALPTARALLQTLHDAQQSMQGQHYRRAAHLAGILRRIAEPLLRRRDEDGSRGREQIAALETLCSWTRRFASDHDKDPVRDGSTRVLRELICDQYGGLAARLLGELQIFLAGRMRFVRHYRLDQPTPAMPEDEALSLTDLVREWSWDGAVDQSWQTAIAENLAALERNRARAESAAANLMAAWE